MDRVIPFDKRCIGERSKGFVCGCPDCLERDGLVLIWTEGHSYVFCSKEQLETVRRAVWLEAKQKYNADATQWESAVESGFVGVISDERNNWPTPAFVARRRKELPWVNQTSVSKSSLRPNKSTNGESPK